MMRRPSPGAARSFGPRVPARCPLPPPGRPDRPPARGSASLAAMRTARPWRWSKPSRPPTPRYLRAFRHAPFPVSLALDQTLRASRQVADLEAKLAKATAAAKNPIRPAGGLLLRADSFSELSGDRQKAEDPEDHHNASAVFRMMSSMPRAPSLKELGMELSTMRNPFESGDPIGTKF